MYVPAHFAMTAEQVRAVLESGSAGDLVTVGPDGPVATYVPMLFDPDGASSVPRAADAPEASSSVPRAADASLVKTPSPSAADAPEASSSGSANTGLGSLIGHVSRVNDQWRTPGEALFILHGPDDYIEADWLNTPGSANVPTWNYVTVHVYGRLVVHDDPAWMLAAVRRLSAAHGDASVDAMGTEEVGRLLRAIVGVELVISRVDGKAKMSQNKTPAAVAQVIDGLRANGGEATAEWMAEHSLPRAWAKADLLAGIRDRRP